MPTRPEEPDFWSWSLQAYDTNGVAEIMLSLQDEFGLNVNLILWCLWAGEYYPGIEETEVVKLLNSTHQWQQQVTVPLRNIRKEMKSMNDSLPRSQVHGLRRDVKALELEAERLEQLHIAAQTHQVSRQQTEAETAPCHSVYMDMYWQTASRLELPDRLGLESPAERVNDLFLKAKNTIFPKEIAQQDV